MSGKVSPPSLFQRRWWSRRRAHYQAVFDEALLLLRQCDALWSDEPNIVRELRFLTVTARRKLDPKGRFGSPCFEAQNPPDPNSDRVQAFERKKPDIQWHHDDENAEDDRHREKSFIIECKRLGATTQSGWNLNEQYVISGIARFVSPDFRYGDQMSEGMMIGFIQTMDPAAILGIINGHLTVHNLPLIQMDGSFVTNGVSGLRHELVRSFHATAFQLAHRWLDIRKVPQRVN